MNTTVIIKGKIKRKRPQIVVRNYDTIMLFDQYGNVQVTDKGHPIFRGTFEDVACLFISNQFKTQG